MSKKQLLGLVLFLVSFTSFPVYSQLNGTKTIDPAGSGENNYTSFSSAISALNSNGTTSGVTFLIASGTYTESTPMTINITANKPSAAATVTFKPAAGATVVLNIGGQDGTNRFGIKIGTASATTDYIILDGSNTDGGTTRDWTIKATSTSYGLEPLDIYGDYIVVKNCIIDVPSGLYGGSSFGITLRDASPVSTYCTIDNNKVSSNNAISIGRGTANDMPGHVIGSNEVHFYNRGIYAYRSSFISIQNNTITGNVYNSYPGGACYGIYTASPGGNTGSLVISGNTINNVGKNNGTAGAQAIRGIAASGPGTYTICNNRIFNIYNATSGTGNPIVYCLQLYGGGSTSQYDVYNNMISGIYNDDTDAGSGVYTYGIQYNTSGNANIYNNTVVIDETSRDHLCAAFAATGGNAVNTVNVKNNIFCNKNSGATYKSYAFYKSASLTSALVSDYNLLYTDILTNAYVGFNGTADAATLNDWQTIDRDSHSKSAPVTFTSATDLHLAGTSIGDETLIGTPLAMITTDIDGDLRDVNYPYMGADENADQLPVELVSFTAAYAGDKVTLQWATATEVDNYGFEIERTNADGQWGKIGFVGGNGNSNSPKFYLFTDDNLSSCDEYKYRLKQLDNDGKYVYSSVAAVRLSVAKDIELMQNYPNPFNPATVIKFSIPQSSIVKLTVYNIVGESVADLLNELRQAGTHYVQFDASNLPSGIYFYRLQSGNYTRTMKMQLIK
ncbi:MAG: T9SS type A sorting domain-containing protein [Bacteroidota bacterium]